MDLFWIILGIILGFLLISIIIALICFIKIFYSPKRKMGREIQMLYGEIYDAYRDQMKEWTTVTRGMPHTDVSVTSFDGLCLRGKFYEHAKGAPIEIMFHGYRGSAEKHMSAGVLRAFKVGHSALIVDHRGSGESDGNVITFGINESRDCHSWIDFVISEIDPNAKIILTGISMGAATVMTCSSHDLPANVVGILADCGYTSVEDVIKKVMRDMKLPPNLLYPFVRLGAHVFGGFNIDESSPIESLASSKLPVFFVHGDTDDFVPYEMSVKNYEACASKKVLVTIEGAGHGLCYPVNPEKYIAALHEFFDPITNTEITEESADEDN